MPWLPWGQTIRPSFATRGQSGAESAILGTSRFTVGPATATAEGEPDRTTRRTDGVTSVTHTTVSTSTGRSPSGGGVVTWVEPNCPPKGADPADSGGMESTGPAIEDGC
jgi:hypothetical protein